MPPKSFRQPRSKAASSTRPFTASSQNESHGHSLGDAIARWLVDADRIPGQVARDWARGVALLPAGHVWEAVQAPLSVGRAVIVSGFALGMGVEVSGWPVVCDPDNGILLFLVPVGTGATWAIPGTVCLSNGLVPVPALTLDGPCMSNGKAVAAAAMRCEMAVPHWPQPPLLLRTGEVVLADADLLAQGLIAAAKPTATTGWVGRG